ncbi:hypothetical protein EVAR_103628_1 [Eumeta japonica]|uniref:Uncharacterized protein n=1 Tax=Eumeta variegata TaxID=151549 RepID=A0A4C1ZHV2_EUMVA|nr:hypothetical protein EVAR_103628_1 [Eumeta japonica]
MLRNERSLPPRASAPSLHADPLAGKSHPFYPRATSFSQLWKIKRVAVSVHHTVPQLPRPVKSVKPPAASRPRLAPAQRD